MRTILLLMVFICVAAANARLPKGYVCFRASDSIVVDGSLIDAAWQKAPWTDDFTDIEGEKKPAPRFKTRVKMLWDDQYFYIGAELAEPQVWATIAKRDDVIFHDNDFEVFMDPNGDNFEYGEFEINALNTGWDLFLPKPYKDGGHADDGWNIDGIRTAVAIKGTLNNPTDTDIGWSVEIAMPWASLERISHTKQAPKDGAQWRVNFSRVEWLTDIVGGTYKKVDSKPEDNWVWSPQGVIDMHRPEHWGFVQFVSKSEGPVALLPDTLALLRNELHDVYYAEKEFFKAHNQWTGHVSELSGLSPSRTFVIALSDSGYVATMSAGHSIAHIRQDAYFWTSPSRNR